MKRLFLSSLLALCFLSAPALSAVCYKRPDLLKGTEETGTFPKVRVMSQNATGAPLMYELFVNKAGDTLVVTTQSNGISCVVATGVGFQIVEPTTPGTSM
jgi:hypothetical protein